MCVCVYLCVYVCVCGCVANLTVVVHLAEDCRASSMKL